MEKEWSPNYAREMGIKLYVRVLSGRMMCVRVGEQRLVESLKNQILSKLRMPTDSNGCLYQTLSETGELTAMEDNKTISQCGIKSGAILYFSMEISVQLKIVTGGNNVIVDIQTSDTIQEVKQKIHVRVGIPPEEQRLIFHGKLVEDSGAVQDYGIKNNDELYMIRRICQYHLLVSNSSTCRDLTVKVEPGNTIMDVKVAIAKLEQIPIHQQQLMFHNQLLDDGKTVKHYGIGRGCKVTLAVHAYQCTGQIFIRTLVGKIITVDIGVNDTVAKVKSVIESKEGVPPNQQKLTFMGKTLRNGTLSTYGVQKESTLDLSLCICGGANGSRCMKISIKKTKGGTGFKIEVASANTIAELKRKIQTHEKIPPDQQQLIFAGKVLEDYQTLESYNIESDATLHLFVRRPGERRITVKTRTNKEICRFNEVPSKPIQSLISTIEDMEGIPKSYQRLIFNGEELDHQKSLSDYKFVSDRQNIVYLEFIGPIQVFIHILSGMESATVERFDKRISMRASEEMKVSALKTCIEHREKIPVYLQTLLYEGKVIDNCNTLKNYFICDKSVICLSLEKAYHVQLSITVKTPSKTLQNLPKFHLHTTIEEVKQSIQEVMDSSHCPTDGADNSPIQQQSLFYDNILLDNDKSLRDYMVTDGSTLYLLPPEEFPVFVQATIDGTFTSIFIGAKKENTIRMLKNKMRTKIPVDHSLYLSSVLLNDSKTVERCRITPACTLNSVYPKEIPISIKTRHTTVSFGVIPSKPVATIMEMITRNPEIGVPQNKQRLLYHHQVLSEGTELQEKSIKDCHISAGNTLTLVVMPNELELYITTSRGSTLTLVCHTDDRIRDVKAVVEEIEGIPVENQILPFSDDEKTLKKEDIKCGTHLDIGCLSVVPVKCIIDQQKKWENAILKNERLEKEKKSLEEKLELVEDDVRFLELQLDSASDHMEKTKNWEQEKKELEQKVESAHEEMKLVNMQLDSALQYTDKLIARYEMKNNEMHSVGTQTKEDTADGPTVNGFDDDKEVIAPKHPRLYSPAKWSSYICLSQDKFVYCGEELHRTWGGLQLHFPEQDIGTEVDVTVKALSVSRSDLVYDIANDAELVSAVYQIRVSEPLPQAVLVEMQHDHDSASSIKFVHSNSKQNPPYQFKVIEGCYFKANTVYAKIEFSHFANVAIAQFDQSPFIYYTKVFMRQSSLAKYEVHVVVNLADHIGHLPEYNDWVFIGQQEVDFEEDSISVNIPIEGKESNEGWKVTTMLQPAKITKRSVNEYEPGKPIPHIPLRLKSVHTSPLQDDVTVALTGTREPVSFIIDCDPAPSSVSSDITASYHGGGTTILSEQVDLRLFGLIKYNDGKGQKELRIKDQIEAHWRDLAPHLGFEPGKIRTLAKSQAPNDEMMAQWLQRDPKNCWERLIQKLKDAGLKTAANDLKHALCHMIPSEND